MHDTVKTGRSAPIVLLATILSATPLLAQEERVEIEPGVPFVTRQVIDRALEEDGARVHLFGRSEIAADDTLTGSVVQVGGSLVVAGTVTGDVTGIDAEVFVRPGARVEGRLTVLAGAYYGTTMADLANAPVWLRDEPLRVVRAAPDRARIEHQVRGLGFPFEPKGLNGVTVDDYNGVDGFSFGLVAGLKHLPGQPETELAGGPVFRTNRDEVGYRIAGLREFRGTGGLTVGGSVYSVTASPQSWHRGTFSNALASLFLADDDKTWYEREGYSLWVERPFRYETVTVRARWRDDDFGILESETPFSFFGDDDDWRENPAIDDGEGRALGVEATWDRRDDPDLPRSGWWVTGRYDHWGFGGDFEFDFAQADARAYLPVPGGDRSFASFRAVGGGRLGDPDTLAPQFWYRLGGGSTLPGYDSLEPILTGDRMAFATVTFHHGIPTTSKLMDRLYLVALATVGDAWFEDGEFEANTGVGAGIAANGQTSYAGLFAAYGVETEEWQFYARLGPWF